MLECWRSYDSPAWKEFAQRNNFEDNWQNAAEWGKSLTGQQAEINGIPGAHQRAAETLR